MELSVEEEQLIRDFRKMEKDLVDVIAVQKGWAPLDMEERMVVHFGKNCYIVKRVNELTSQRLVF